METNNLDEKYWNDRYSKAETGWDIGTVSTPLKNYIDQLENKNISILIPGAGNAYEALYLVEKGFTNVTVCDLSLIPLEPLLKHKSLKIIHGDFFDLTNTYDLMLEQTFFCALDPLLRISYVNKVAELLNEGGKLVGVLFDRIFDIKGPPFGGFAEEYKELFKSKFNFNTFEKCTNSIAPRAGYEIFINLNKK